MNIWTKKKDLSEYFAIFGTFGRAVGRAKIETIDNVTTVSGCVNGCYMESSYYLDESGVTVRTGKVRNDSPDQMTLSTVLYRYTFNGGEYEVYSQYNGWLNESTAAWQPLVSSVSAYSETPRSCSSSVPNIALYSLQVGRGVAFDIMPNGAWELNVRVASGASDTTDVVVEAGNLVRKQVVVLEPGEEIVLPTVLSHTFVNRNDLDGWKVQRYAHRTIPQKTMPVIYNTWLYRFDHISYEDLSKQIPKAAEMGCEYFVIDAGWFGVGKANWMFLRGDWKENMTANLCGKMKTLADETRAHGMKFGFWLETETAGCNSEIIKAHPDWFICDGDKYHLDFTNKEAVDSTFETVCSLIDYYGAEFLKFDHNQDLMEDKSLTSMRDYTKGYVEYVSRIRERYPDLYLQCCASGGMRTDLTNCRIFDSYWPSDNMGPQHGIHLLKELLKRMPLQRIERWACVTSFASTQHCPQDKILMCDDWSWDRITSVNETYLKAFLTGGPIGFSCDLTLLSDYTFGMLQQFVAQFKEEREYWDKVEVRVLCDTDSVLVLQYADPDFCDVRVQVISHRSRQSAINIYPILDENATYHYLKDSEATGKEIMENGVFVGIEELYYMSEVRFIKEN